MLPKSSKHFIKPTADRLNEDVDLVEDAVGFFYATLRKNLTMMTGPNIQVENIGSFKAKPKELLKLLAKYNHRLRVMKPETFTQVTIHKDIQNKLARVEALQYKVLSERARQAIFIKEKNERKSKKNME